MSGFCSESVVSIRFDDHKIEFLNFFCDDIANRVLMLSQRRQCFDISIFYIYTFLRHHTVERKTGLICV